MYFYIISIIKCIPVFIKKEGREGGRHFINSRKYHTPVCWPKPASPSGHRAGHRGTTPCGLLDWSTGKFQLWAGPQVSAEQPKLLTSAALVLGDTSPRAQPQTHMADTTASPHRDVSVSQPQATITPGTTPSGAPALARTGAHGGVLSAVALSSREQQAHHHPSTVRSREAAVHLAGNSSDG